MSGNKPKKHVQRVTKRLPACGGGMKPTPRGSVRSNIFGVPTYFVLDATHGEGFEPVCSPGRFGSKSRLLVGDRPDVRQTKNTSSPMREHRGTCALRARSCSMEARSPSMAWLGSARSGGSSRCSYFLAATVQRADRDSDIARVRSPPRVSLNFFHISKHTIF